MKYKIVQDFPNDVLYERGDVCISIYMPTHRYKMENQKDRIMFKNQIQKAERSLLQKFSKKEVEEILSPLYDLEQDMVFWNRTRDAVAIFLNREHCIIYNLFREIKELTVVSNSFHIKPLIRVYQSVDKYYVLGINRHNFKLFYGDRYNLTEIESPKNMPDEITEEYRLTTIDMSKDGKAMYSTGSNRDEVKKETEKYLRNVDRYIWENYIKPTGAPLVLVALPQYQGEFRKLTNNKLLVEKGIDKDFEAMDINAIKEEAWKIIEKIYLDRTEMLVNMFNNGKSKGNASANINDVVKKAVEGRIDTILIESDKILPGIVDMETKEIKEMPLEDVETDDVLDDIAEMVLKAKGEVVILPKEKMPDTTGVAAIYRY
ncbi:hypothetical protein [Miniphocaeibacter halophilus]|uniref:Uncharacterized protein n=1 Tax=Miniphocaeibacter halophilus TaxID=2931922 RepID=A0AC61MMM4_9FIRM|nr:hypothetical protein [Miniphocaeibacter halophilus]QQK06935.1 hypothetical protein JFY71_06185 [Miniphocaeibacter halophilus]